VDFTQLIRTVLENEQAAAMTSGAVVLSALAWLGYQARSLPSRIVGLIEAQFTTSLLVQGDDAPYQNLLEWMSHHPMTRRMRRLGVVTTYDAKNERQRYEMTPGPGRHFLRDGGRWFMIERNIHQRGQASGSAGGEVAPTSRGGVFGRQESITLTTFGRSHTPLRELLEALDLQDVRPRDRISVFAHGSGETPRTKRPLETIYCDPIVKAALLAEIEAFRGNRAWCAERGIPWRRGFLLNGPPGTGKTSLIFALASHFDVPIFTVNPATLFDDGGLAAALAYPPRNAFVVIEDADSVEALKARPNLERIREQDERRSARNGSDSDRSAPPSASGVRAGHVGRYASAAQATEAAPSRRDDGYGRLTLSGFLNAIDGLSSAEGRILFLTTNCPDDLDPALTRPGRIDRVFHLGPAREGEARAMFARFFPEADADAFARLIAPRLPMAQAELQNLMLALAEAGDPVGAAHEELARRFAA
jgi:mitochondrial chaperone BCS1